MPFKELTISITDDCPEDFEALYQLTKKDEFLYFGQIKRKIGNAHYFFRRYITHRLMARHSSTDATIIGYCEFSNNPYIPALSADSWLDWLEFHYCIPLPLNVANTFFFNTYIYEPTHDPELTRQILSEVFYREDKVRYIIAIQVPNYGFFSSWHTPYYFCLEPFATTYYPKCFSLATCVNTQRVHIVSRDAVIPKMCYRKALPEDNDDVVDIMHSDRPELKVELGEYYIAEELLNEKSTNSLIITEISNSTAGFIWLDDRVDIFKLLQNYEFENFGYLIKYNPKAKTKEFQMKVKSTVEEQTRNDNFKNERFEEFIRNQEENASQDLYFDNLEKLTAAFTDDNFYNGCKEETTITISYNPIEEEDFNEETFQANSNVFQIRMFGLHSKYNRRRLFRYLLASFSAFPERCYCLLSLPSMSHLSANDKQILKYFMPVQRRPNSESLGHLFITHRNAIYDDLIVRETQQEDINDVKSFFTTSDFGEAVYNSKSPINIKQAKYDLDNVEKIFNNIFSDPFSEYKAFTISCGATKSRTSANNVMVGFAIVRPFNSNKIIRQQFDVPKCDEALNLIKYELVILKLHPLFHFQADLLFRELARQSNYWHLYYFRPKTSMALSNDLMLFMQPLEPRKIKKIWFNTIPCEIRRLSPIRPDNQFRSMSKIFCYNNLNDDLPRLQNLELLTDYYAVFKNNLCNSTMISNKGNLVILGFTDMCKALLRQLIFSWHNSKKMQSSYNCLPQLNVTVICDPGHMEAEYETAFVCQFCSRPRNCWVNSYNSDAFIRDVTNRMDVRNWIRFVSGKVQSIDEKNRLITLDSNCQIDYEILLLLNETEFGPPAHIFEDADDDDDTPLPTNYIQINNRFDKIQTYYKLMVLLNSLAQDYSPTIIVYGNNLRTYEFVNFLLQHGCKPAEIKLVLPSLKIDLKLNDSNTDANIQNILCDMVQDLGVQIYEAYNISRFLLHENDSKKLKAIVFKTMSGDEELHLECDLFACFHERYFAPEMMEASFTIQLVYLKANLEIQNESILVDENYCTSNPHIYAFGKFIKHKTEPNHQYYFVSPHEAAEKLMDILELLDDSLNDYLLEKEQRFAMPFYFQAQLPLHYNCVKITKPKRYLANHLDNQYGFNMITYYEGDFTRVKLNEHGLVEEIMVVTTTKMDYDFLKYFCGHHELLLNNLKSRWFLKDFISFFDFFQEPWTEIIMHDQFKKLQFSNKNFALPKAYELMDMNVDRELRNKLLHDLCLNYGIKTQIENNFMHFVRKHRNDFATDIALPEDFLGPNGHSAKLTLNN